MVFCKCSGNIFYFFLMSLCPRISKTPALVSVNIAIIYRTYAKYRYMLCLRASLFCLTDIESIYIKIIIYFINSKILNHPDIFGGLSDERLGKSLKNANTRVSQYSYIISYLRKITLYIMPMDFPLC